MRAVLRRQFGAEPALESRRLGTQIDDHVEGSAAHAARDLDLGVCPGLEVHAAQRSHARAEAGVDLADGGLEAVIDEFLGAENSREVPSIVRARLLLQHMAAGDVAGFEDHLREQSPTRGLTGCSGRPSNSA